MPSKYDRYVHDTWVDSWIASCYAMTFTRELCNILYANDMILDNVLIGCNNTNEPSGNPPTIQWQGQCYDADLVDYHYTAIWYLNADKVHRGEIHYYDLVDLEIVPEQEYSSAAVHRSDNDNRVVGSNKRHSASKQRK